jgi:hypothetical protein
MQLQFVHAFGDGVGCMVEEGERVPRLGRSAAAANPLPSEAENRLHERLCGSSLEAEEYPLKLSQGVAHLLAIGKCEFRAEGDKGTGEGASHPYQHVWPGDHVPAYGSGQQPVAYKDHERQQHEDGA